MPSFWSDNPFAQAWTTVAYSWWNRSPPLLIVQKPMGLPEQKVGGALIPGIRVEIGKLHFADHIALFLQKWFKLSSKCRCVVTTEDILRWIESEEWIFLCAWETEGQRRLVGTVARRTLGCLRVDSSDFSPAKLIDFFCIHGAWRQRGLGRMLLYQIHAYITQETAPHPMPPVLFLYERPQMKVAPLAWGRLMVRATKQESLSIPAKLCEAKDALAVVPRGANSVIGWSEKKGRCMDTIFVECGGWYGAIGDTYCVSVPEGRRVGIFLGSWPAASSARAQRQVSQAEANEAMIDRVGSQTYGYMLTHISIPRSSGTWESDAEVQWIGYNLSSGPPRTTYPLLLL
jgi:hypothetical protein